MKKIYLETDDENTIFAKKEGKLTGMVVNEEGKGWITRIGGTFGACGHCDNLRECILKGQKYGYEYLNHWQSSKDEV